jgi:hypothetical protein
METGPREKRVAYAFARPYAYGERYSPYRAYEILIERLSEPCAYIELWSCQILTGYQPRFNSEPLPLCHGVSCRLRHLPLDRGRGEETAETWHGGMPAFPVGVGPPREHHTVRHHRHGDGELNFDARPNVVLHCTAVRSAARRKLQGALCVLQSMHHTDRTLLVPSQYLSAAANVVGAANCAARIPSRSYSSVGNHN